MRLQHDWNDHHRLPARLLRNPATMMPAIREVLFAEYTRRWETAPKLLVLYAATAKPPMFGKTVTNAETA